MRTTAAKSAAMADAPVTTDDLPSAWLNGPCLALLVPADAGIPLHRR